MCVCVCGRVCVCVGLSVCVCVGVCVGELSLQHNYISNVVHKQSHCICDGRSSDKAHIN